MHSPYDLRPHMIGWQERNVAHWDSLASDYDGPYTSSWSRLENDEVSRELTWIKDPAKCRVIDVGCGPALATRSTTPCSAASATPAWTSHPG
jgi:hypothetical protein